MDEYSLQWRRYRLLNRLGIVAFVVFIGALPLSAALDQSAALAPIAKVTFIAVGATGLFSLWLVLCLIAFWRCPRCHFWYSRRSIVGWHSLKRQCVHCHLKLYEGSTNVA